MGIMSIIKDGYLYEHMKWTNEMMKWNVTKIVIKYIQWIGAAMVPYVFVQPVKIVDMSLRYQIF